MKSTLYNLQSAESHFSEIRSLLATGRHINLSYEIASKEQTKKQTNFWHGGLASQINDYFHECGMNTSEPDTRYLMYKLCSEICPEIVRDLAFGGERVLHINEMDRPITSKFISATFVVLDTNKMFAGLSLRPDTMYRWAFNLDKEEIKAISRVEFPDKDARYLDHIRSLPCIVCGKHAPSEAHHLKQNKTKGISERSEDWMAMPLCSQCHHGLAHNHTDQFHEALKWIPIDIVIFLKLCYLRWLNHN